MRVDIVSLHDESLVSSGSLSQVVEGVLGLSVASVEHLEPSNVPLSLVHLHGVDMHISVLHHLQSFEVVEGVVDPGLGFGELGAGELAAELLLEELLVVGELQSLLRKLSDTEPSLLQRPHVLEDGDGDGVVLEGRDEVALDSCLPLEASHIFQKQLLERGVHFDLLF